jgi:hypothetical protein
MEVFINVTTMLTCGDTDRLCEFKTFGIHDTLEVFTALSTKITIFCNVTPCNLVKVHQCLRGTYCVHLHGQRASQDNGTLIIAGFSLVSFLEHKNRCRSLFLNVSKFLLVCMASRTKRLYSSDIRFIRKNKFFMDVKYL